VIYNYLNNIILEFLIPDLKLVSSIALDSFLFRHEAENVKVFLPENIDLIFSIFTRFILPISMWFLVWLKLKEKQV